LSGEVASGKRTYWAMVIAGGLPSRPRLRVDYPYKAVA